MIQTSCTMYTKTEEAWKAMLFDCARASVSIDIEQYIFEHNEIGDKFLEILKRKTKEGVKIRMLIDTAGSYSFYQSQIPGQLRKLGIQVRFFNIISPWRIPNFFSWFFRNHKKTLVIDKRVGFTGGTGMGDHMKDWRDTTGRLEGAVVMEITASFEDMWYLADETNIISKVKLFRGYTKKQDFITNAPYFQKRFLYHTLMNSLSKAKENIHLTTPYFVPDRRLISILKRAVRRGVDVRVILPEKIDVPLVASASHSSFGELLKHGVKIFKYSPSVLHAKTAVVDGVWGTYGSFNLDSLSFRYNYEGNIVTTDPNAVAQLGRHFEEDLKNSKEITLASWKVRSFSDKIRELLVWPFRGLL